jgi:tetratricopeptide (TPR) repeat protein
MSTQVKTQAQAINELRDAIIEFESNGFVNDELKVSVSHSLRDIQVRDFLMGVTFEGHSTELVANFVEHLSTTAITEEVAPIYSVLASYRYRLGNTKGASECLDKATEADPKHSLTLLLRRVIGSGWPAGAFDAMTIELHPKVVAGIEAGADLDIK